MIHSNIKYLLISVLLVILFTESCSTGSKSLFEKRKHLKGWHFHKQGNINQNPGKSLSNKFKKDDEEVQSVNFNNKNEISSLEIREWNALANNTENENLVGVSSSTNNQVTSSQRKLENKNSGYKLVDKQTNFNSLKSDKKPTKKWSFSGAYFFLLMLFPLVMKYKKPNQIQIWAARNKAKSRTLLVFLKILLAATSISLGLLLGVPFSLPLLLFSVVILTVTIGISEYWKKKNKLTNKKKLGLLWVFNSSTSFGFFSFGGMLQNGFDFSQWTMMNGLLEASASNPENEFVYHPVSIVILAILLTAALFILLYSIGFLSCMIYCSGYEFLGISLFVVSGFMVLFGYFYLTLKLFRRKDDTEAKKRKRVIISLLLAGVVQALIWLSTLIYQFI